MDFVRIFCHECGVLRQQVMLRLAKTQGMGLSIVAAKGVGKDRLGIYIKVSFCFYF